MHQLKLVKGRSYHGMVCATRQHPEIFVEDEESYQTAMASGYFEELPVFLEEEEERQQNILIAGTKEKTTVKHAAKGRKTEDAHAEFRTEKEKRKEDKIESSETGERMPARTQEAKMQQKETAKHTIVSLAEMNLEELKAYALLHGISLSGLKKKEEIFATIQAAEAQAAEARKALRIN